MMKPICPIMLFLLAPLAVAQVSSPPEYPQTHVQMKLPPPVSSLGFPTIIGEGELANYIEGDIGLRGGYVNNLYPGSGVQTLDDGTFSVEPSLSTNRSGDRFHANLRYAPTFDFYSPDSALNTINNTGGVGIQYRTTPYTTILAGDTVTQTSNTWSQPLSSGSIPGGLPPASPGFIAPFAPQILNSAYAQFTWQFAQDGMIGVGGNSTVLDYYTPSQAQGLFNSDSWTGSAFYTQRFGAGQYLGGSYQYSLIRATPAGSTGPARTNLDANNFLGFYTLFMGPTISVSVGAGSQRYNLDQSSVSPIHAWAPIALASIGWQLPRTTLALNYTHLITQGQGLIGAYTSNAASLSSQLQLSPNWITTVRGDYSQLTPVSTSVVNSTPGGHTISFTGELARHLGAHFTLSAQYQYLHQNYLGIPSISSNPNSSRETASILYHFSRPLGR